MKKTDTQDTSPVILLTACINPSGMALTTLQNPDLRKMQYLSSLKFYILNTKFKIVFVENSGVDITNEFRVEINEGRLEVLTFDGNDYDKRLGKGFGEMLILRHATENSIFIKKATTICKITGRYKISNINQLVKAKNDYDCDLMIDLTSKMHFSDSRIFFANYQFFRKYLFIHLEKLSDDNEYYFEHALVAATLQAIIDGVKYRPLKYKPRIIGQSGTDGRRYKSSFISWFPRNLQQIFRFYLFK